MFDVSQILDSGLPEVSVTALFLIFFFGTFVSEDAVCVLAGTSVASGRISFALAVIACFLGIFVSDVMLYLTGRVFGSRILESKAPNRFISKRSTEKASQWLNRNAAAAVFISRFISGLRLPTYLLAGALKTHFGEFALYFLIASAIWTPILVGSTAFAQSFIFSKNLVIGFVFLAVASRLLFKYSSAHGRRLLIGRLKRIRKWEFWPIQIFYAPVVVYIFLLSIRFRGVTVFTAANPALPAGGFKGESKNQIYCGLKKSRPATEHVLPYTLLRKECAIDERLRQAWTFIDLHDLSYPIVLKPDVGERGKGVRIIRTDNELEDEVLSADVDQILQEFAPGDEVSIFYFRYPNGDRGKIFSITKKHLPVLQGDGYSTVEELILKDQRAVCLAHKYFEQNADRLLDVAAPGEAVQLVDIGTHSRGAIFLDGERLRSVALERKIDEICCGYEGFYFGRFDIRTESLTDFRVGKNFKIIELNGVTSESTNIYDPIFSLLGAYRILFRQWRIAFEIGMQNIKLGTRPTPFADLIRRAFGQGVETVGSAEVCDELLQTAA